MSTHCQAASFEKGRPDVLLIGDLYHHEFREAVGWLKKRANLSLSVTVDEAFERSEHRARCWHTVIFAQSRPGQFSAFDINRVTRSFPLAHCVALLGSLCEGESRSGNPWPGMARVYWHEFVARGPSELTASSPPRSWQLPRTASELERTEVMLATTPVKTSGMLVVFSQNASLFDAISSACQKIGYSTTWCWNDRCRVFRGADAAVWDGTFQGRIDYQELSRITSALSPVPVVALLSFPRHDHWRKARENGARSMISAPFMLPDLWNVLQEVSSSDAGGCNTI